MVFPSFAFQIETGLISQISTLIVIGFSVAINYWKKITLYTLLALSLLVGAKAAFAIAYVTGHCGTGCVNNTNYYGNPWVRPGVYYYPQTMYHSFYGPTPNYFRPHYQSPYMPQWMYNCPHCGGNQGWQMPNQNNWTPTQGQGQNHGPMS